MSKATGVPLAKIATKVMIGQSLREQGIINDPYPKYFAVKESVLPFNRFEGADPFLGPEMKSTGEVMGIDPDLGIAFMKSQIAAGQKIPDSGKVFISVKDTDKEAIKEVGKQFAEMGFEILATSGTADALEGYGIPVMRLSRLEEGRPNIVDFIKNGNVGLLINTPSGPEPRRDEVHIRSVAISQSIPIVTTIQSASVIVKGIKTLRTTFCKIRAIQDVYFH